MGSFGKHNRETIEALQKENTLLKKQLEQLKSHGFPETVFPNNPEHFISRSPQTALLTKAISKASNAMVISNEKGLIEYANKAFETLTGYSVQEAIGKNPRDLVKSGLHTEEFYQDLWDTITQDKVWKGVIINKRKDGTPYHEKLTITPFTEPSAGKRYYIAVKEDISEKVRLEKELEESEQRFKTLMDDVSEIAVQGYKPDGRVFFWNKASEKLYGYTRSEAMGQNILDLIIPENMKPEAKRQFREIRKGRRHFDPREYELRRKDEEPVHVYSTHTVLTHANNEKELFCIDIDITQRNEAKRQIEKQAKESQIIADLGRALLGSNSAEKVFSLMGESLEKALPQTIIVVTKFLPDGKNLRIFQILGMENSLLTKALKLLNLDISQKTFPRIRDDFYEPKRLNKLDNGFEKLLTTEYPGFLVRRLQKILAIQDVFTINISTRNQSFGNIAIMTQSPDYQPNKQLVETIVYQGAITLLQTSAFQSLTKSEEKYRLIFEKSPVGVLHFNTSGIITHCNQQFVNIVGSSKEKLIGLNMLQLPDHNVVNVVKKVLQGETASWDGQYQSVTADKSTPVRLLFAPVISKDVVEGGTGLVEDRSSQLQKEKLENEIAVALESARFKQSFLASMSHEIRTPLTGIIGIIDILEKADLPDTERELLSIMKNSSENLKEIINQVLDFSKIEAGKIKLKPRNFDLNHILETTKNLFYDSSGKNIVFQIRKDPKIPRVIFADESRITQIINNLLFNAVKFTTEGKITLHSNLIEQSSDRPDVKIKIEVEDTGKGIPLEKQKMLFKPFVQVDEKSFSHTEGTGLGLSICKELTTLMGGQIGVNSQPGKGSTFWFTFVARRAQYELVSQQTERKHPSQPKSLNILLAEDKVVNQKVITLMLKSQGHNVVVANNGHMALSLYKENNFDLILMDIQMPLMDGVTATNILKANHSDLPPIVGLSANALEGDREKFMAMGMDEYITKPVKRDDFNELTIKLFG